MPRQNHERSRVARLAHELIDIRRRGLDNLEVHTAKQPERVVPITQALADDYCHARGLDFGGDRIAAIRVLLRDGLEAFAAQGQQADSELLTTLYFGPTASDPPKPPTEVLKALKVEKETAGSTFDFDAWRTSAFPRFAAFLIAFVAETVQQTAPPPPPSAATAASGTEHQWPLVTLLLAAGLVTITLAAVFWLAGKPAPAHSGATAASDVPTTITGYAKCAPDAAKPVVGVWIVAANGGSGWADWHALPGQANVAWFSRTLPNGGGYVVHVGCGGTQAHWELTLASLSGVLGSGYTFTCYDVPPAQDPSQARCQP